MDTKDIDQARKLSNTEMEGQKGGASFAKLERFVVKGNFSRPNLGGFNPAADTSMCAGQTRSNDLFTNVSQINQLQELTQVRLAR